MASASTFITLCEVGPRDGFQYEDRVIPTELKLDVIAALADAGLPEIQVASFVHPKWVPQMADAEAVCRRLPERDDVTYTGLALNTRGVERAHNAGLRHVDLSISASETQSRRNANRSHEEALASMLEMIELCHRYGLEARAGLQCVFGYLDEAVPLERVLDMARPILEAGVFSLSLADTTGLANPVQIKEVVRAVQELSGETPLVLHLHDTRGLGLANVVAALDCGVRRFDTAFAGMGGCPFIPGASGNIATEDTVYLLESIGFTTGVDLARVAAVSRRMETFLDKQYPGKLHHLI